MSDRMLRTAEDEAGDPDDVDAGTLDEVVERVIADYSQEADLRVRNAVETSNRDRDRLRRRELAVDGHARRGARLVGAATYLALLAVLVVASVVLLIRDVFTADAFVAAALILIAVLQLTGTLGQFRSAALRSEEWAYRRLRTILGADLLVSDVGDR